MGGCRSQRFRGVKLSFFLFRAEAISWDAGKGMGDRSPDLIGGQFQCCPGGDGEIQMSPI